MAGHLVCLDEADGLRAAAIATLRSARYPNSGPYGSNAIAMHETGALGEVAVVRWAESLDLAVENLAEVPEMDRHPDAVIAGVRVEVKTFSARTWTSRQATISAYQLDSIRRKAEVLVFCKALPPSAAGTTDVEVVGWLSLQSYIALAEPYFDPDFRPQYRVGVRRLHEPRMLASALASGDTTAITSAAVPAPSTACGHRPSPGRCLICAIPKGAPISVSVSAGSPGLFHLADPAEVSRAHPAASPPVLVGVAPFFDVVGIQRPCPSCFPRPPIHGACPSCWLTLPASGECDYCL